MRTRQRRLARAVGTTVVALLAVTSGFTGNAGAEPPPTPPNEHSRGMVWEGLVAGQAGSRCRGLYEVRGQAGEVLGCTHGPDLAPLGMDVTRRRPATELAEDAAALPKPVAGPGTNGDGIACIGDGVSGYRVEAIYAVASTVTDRYATIAPLIRSTYASYVEWQYQTSAAQTGATAHVPYVTSAGAGCTLTVRHEVLTASGDDNFSNTMSQLRARGYTRTDRRYMVFMDANVLCGIGQIYRDSQSGQNNANNGFYSAFGRSDNGCWGYAEGHELMHNLGGVQVDAPHATPGWHCWDENDQMCYDDDGAGGISMQSVCPTHDERLFDCNKDDYFHGGSPPAGTWLAGHWNTYDSRFLNKDDLGSPTNAAPTVSAGPDRSVSLGQSASLDGTVGDDGLPAGSSVTQAWAKVSGPGTVGFASATSVDTTATFSAAGTYTLSLTASDSVLSSSDTVVVTVTDPNAPVTETFTGSFNKNRTSVTHSFTSGAGTVTVTITGPGNRTITGTLRSGSTTIATASGRGTFSLPSPSVAAGTYSLVMTGTNGSYTATVRHPA